jgi:AcrR family transcriptional regulator
MARKHDEQAQAILDAASCLLSDEGPGALTVRRIATAAGCSTMGVYSRFGNKDGVVDELFAEGFEHLLDGLGALAVTDDPVDDLRRRGHRYREVAHEHATHYMVMFGGVVPGFTPSERNHELAMSAFDGLVAAVQRCIDAGRFHGDAADLAQVHWATMHGLVMLELVGLCPLMAEEPERRYDRALDLMFAGFSTP